jgi:BCD family chlorophyll transporter-like MFS transporter
MGVWGAAQAIAFGLGGLIGALGVDGARALLSGTGPAFQLVFASEAALFLAGAGLALAAPARTSGQRMAIA